MLHRSRQQRGITMISVMMLTVSLLTLGLLAVRTSVREVQHAGQLVARERATMAAQAAVDFAASRYMGMTDAAISDALAGYNAGDEACTSACGDCIPGGNAITGRRNDIVLGETVGCGGRPCMRQGAVAQLNDEDGVLSDWCEVPLRSLVTGADAEAQVTVWVRNNTADALGPDDAGGSGLWEVDSDGRVVITAMATVRNTTVTVEKEVQLQSAGALVGASMGSPDEGYGGGHNNDNTSVSLCTEEYLAVSQE